MRKNVMLAEDDQDDQMFFKEAVDEISNEIQLQIKNNGEELMTTLINDHGPVPDIIFIDLNMPIKDGFSCLQEIKVSEKLKNCTVVILTTSNNPDHMDLAYKLGATLYVCKPNNFKDLKSILNEIFLRDFTVSNLTGKMNYQA